MSAFSAARRAEVEERAGYRCEYRHLPARGQVATFPIDHIVPRASGGGSHELDNLALCCPHCNAMKWTAERAIDPNTAESVRLFHPRTDIWREHFHWDGARLVGITPTGRATIVALKSNADSMVELRQLLMDCGLFQDPLSS